MTTRTQISRGVLVTLALLSPASGLTHEAHGEHAGHQMQGSHDVHASHAMDDSHDAHALHRQMLTQAGESAYHRSERSYQTPAVTLTDSRGTPVPLAALLDAEGPVILNFIYTSCSTVCPVLSATFAQAQGPLANTPRKPRMVSISIDPAFDTPSRLRDYAEKYHANDDWHFLTGDTATVIAIQRAFDVYRGEKSNHIPVTFLKASAHDPWVRLEGFTSAADLVREYAQLVAH